MKLVLPLALALAFAVLAEEPAAPPPSAADAGTPAAEEKKPEKVRAIVHLKDGGLVRGTVKRIRLGKSITITLSSGKSVTFDYEDIITVEMLGAGAAADAGTAAAAETPAPDSGDFPAQSVTAPTRPPARAPAPPPAAAPAKPGPAQANQPSIAPLPAPSPVSSLDTVFLSDGSLVRGTIESEKPDLVIKLVSGKKRTIASRDVKSVARKGAAPADSNDTVFLKDGSVLRGVIETDKPDVVIRFVSGKKRTVPAASVQKIERARKP